MVAGLDVSVHNGLMAGLQGRLDSILLWCYIFTVSASRLQIKVGGAGVCLEHCLGTLNSRISVIIVMVSNFGQDAMWNHAELFLQLISVTNVVTGERNS